MNENVGASFGLSVLTVVFFAVALYHPDPPAPGVGVSSSAAAGGAEARTLETSEASRPVAARGRPKAAPPSPAPVSAPVPVPVTTAGRVARPQGRATPGATGRVVARRVVGPVATGPRAAFTSAREGERLDDVARRIYGSDDAKGRLWKANRDLIDGPDGLLRVGTLVRTP